MASRAGGHYYLVLSLLEARSDIAKYNIKAFVIPNWSAPISDALTGKATNSPAVTTGQRLES
jgi:hypothetical protein